MLEERRVFLKKKVEISDIKVLEKDEGFSRILRAMELRGTMGRLREKVKRRWRKIIHFNVTFHPTAEWVTKHINKAFTIELSPKYMIYHETSNYEKTSG